MSKHTPGPWKFACDSYGKVRHSRKACIYTVLNGVSGERIERIAGRVHNWDNARLIAEAPAMYDELRACLKEYEANSGYNRMDEIRAILARIDGAS